MPSGDAICSIAGGSWDASYCGHPLFYALCAATCGCADVQAAALAEYATLIGEPGWTCETADCDPMEAVLCPEACAAKGGRRLSAAPGKLGGRLRRALAGFALERSHKARKLGEEELRDYEEVLSFFMFAFLPLIIEKIPIDFLNTSSQCYYLL